MGLRHLILFFALFARPLLLKRPKQVAPLPDIPKYVIPFCKDRNFCAVIIELSILSAVDLRLLIPIFGQVLLVFRIFVSFGFFFQLLNTNFVDIGLLGFIKIIYLFLIIVFFRLIGNLVILSPIFLIFNEEEYRQAKKIIKSFEMQKKNSSNVQK